MDYQRDSWLSGLKCWLKFIWFSGNFKFNPGTGQCKKKKSHFGSVEEKDTQQKKVDGLVLTEQRSLLSMGSGMRICFLIQNSINLTKYDKCLKKARSYNG